MYPMGTLIGYYRTFGGALLRFGSAIIVKFSVGLSRVFYRPGKSSKVVPDGYPYGSHLELLEERSIGGVILLDFSRGQMAVTMASTKIKWITK